MTTQVMQNTEFIGFLQDENRQLKQKVQALEQHQHDLRIELFRARDLVRRFYLQNGDEGQRRGEAFNMLKEGTLHSWEEDQDETRCVDCGARYSAETSLSHCPGNGPQAPALAPEVKPVELHVFAAGGEYVIAGDASDADKCWQEATGERFSTLLWERCLDFQQIGIWIEKEGGVAVPEAEGARVVVRPAMEWVATFGRGYLCGVDR